MQGMDKPRGGGERKQEETGCEVICGAPTTLAVKGLVKVKTGLKAPTS